MVWQDDWTHNAGPFYILLADISEGRLPLNMVHLIASF